MSSSVLRSPRTVYRSSRAARPLATGGLPEFVRRFVGQYAGHGSTVEPLPFLQSLMQAIHRDYKPTAENPPLGEVTLMVGEMTASPIGYVSFAMESVGDEDFVVDVPQYQFTLPLHYDERDELYEKLVANLAVVPAAS